MDQTKKTSQPCEQIVSCCSLTLGLGSIVMDWNINCSDCSCLYMSYIGISHNSRIHHITSIWFISNGAFVNQHAPCPDCCMFLLIFVVLLQLNNSSNEFRDNAGFIIKYWNVFLIHLPLVLHTCISEQTMQSSLAYYKLIDIINWLTNMYIKDHHRAKAETDLQCSYTRWGLLSHFLLFHYFPNFQSYQNNGFIRYNIWKSYLHNSAQPYQQPWTWMWYKGFNKYFTKFEFTNMEKLIYGFVFSNPHESLLLGYACGKVTGQSHSLRRIPNYLVWISAHE